MHADLSAQMTTLDSSINKLAHRVSVLEAAVKKNNQVEELRNPVHYSKSRLSPLGY